MKQKLNADELVFFEICKENIDPKHLSQSEVDMFKSIWSQCDYDGRLSSRQMEVLKSIKYKSDRAKRSGAISLGRVDPSWKEASRIEEKLNIFYNNIGR
jgi:hypothetical protein